MSGKYETYFRFDWQKEGSDFVDEKGVMHCETYEQAHAIFKTKCKELSQRAFAICDGDYSYVNVSVHIEREGSIGDDIDSFYFTMEGEPDDE